MELDAFCPGGHVSESHNFLIFCPRSDLENRWEGGAIDDEGMVACGFKGLRHVRENGICTMVDGRCFTMHEELGSHNLATIGLGKGLMPEADTEHRDPSCEVLDGLK